MGRETRIDLDLVPTAKLRRLFPNLTNEARQTSPADDSYNCIAWAAGDTEHHWWPVDYPTNGVVWPIDADDSIEGFVRAFETLGFGICGTGEFESGYEKIAMFVNADGPSHMSRQLPSGKWTSKMGMVLEDIEHPTVDEICGTQYGQVSRYMKRPMPWTN